MISSAKHGVEECSMIARDIFSTSPKQTTHVSGSASPQKTVTSLWGSPERTSTLVPSPIFGLTAFLAAIESEGAYALDGRGRLLKIYEREGPEENSGEASHETPLLYS